MRTTTQLALALAVATALFSTTALATNGIAPAGLGQTHKAMGGAAAGNPQNTTSMATNPASASFVQDGWDAGLEIFQPNRTATHNVAGTEYSGDGDKNFLVPEFAYKRSWGGNKSIGVVVYGNGGMNTSYSASNPPILNGDSFNTGDSTKAPGINLEQLFIAPTLALKLSERNSIGLSVNLVHQRFVATGLGLFQHPGFTVDSASVTDNGTDTSNGIGATIGWQGKLNRRITAGVAYRSKVNMSKFDKYKGLLTDGGDLDVPAALTIGGAIKATPRTTVAMDIQRVFYGDIPAFANEARIVPTIDRIGDGVGFGWNDQTVVKLGIKHQRTSKVALMAGLNYGKNPVSAKGTNLNILAPGIVEKHLSFGVEYKLSPRSSVTGTYIRTFENSLEGAVTTPITQEYDLAMDQHAAGIAYSVKY